MFHGPCISRFNYICGLWYLALLIIAAPGNVKQGFEMFDRAVDYVPAGRTLVGHAVLINNSVSNV